MPFLIIGALAFIVLATKKPAPQSGGSALATQPTQPTQQTNQVPPVVVAIATGAQVGAVVDKAVNKNSDGATQTGAQVGGALIGGAAALASLGVFSGAIFAALAFFAVASYLVLLSLDDAAKLAYGQNGARKDWEKQWEKVHDACFTRLRAKADPRTTDAEIERELIPLVDGYMRELNRIAFKKFMASGEGPNTPGEVFGPTKGIVISNLGNKVTVGQKWVWGWARGKFVGRQPGNAKEMGKDLIALFKSTSEADPMFPDEILLHSFQKDFAIKYCPPNEIVWTQPNTKAMGA